MYQLKKVLVGLDLTDMDEHLVRYAFFISNLLHQEVEKIIFVHSHQTDGEVPEELLNEFPEMSPAGRQEILSDKLKKIVDLHRDENCKAELLIRAVPGDPLTTMMHLSKVHQVDLIVVGRKNVSDGSGLLARKLARRVLTSVLSVPENVRLDTISKIFVPVDFSDFSKVAVDYALQFATESPDFKEVICMNVYSFPTGFTAGGKTAEEYNQIMLKNAQKNYEKFIEDYKESKFQIRAKYALDNKNAAAKIAYNTALVERADLIVLGSRGRTAAAATLIGSFAEKLLSENANLPMLIIKSKRKNLDMLSALMQL